MLWASNIPREKAFSDPVLLSWLSQSSHSFGHSMGGWGECMSRVQDSRCMQSPRPVRLASFSPSCVPPGFIWPRGKSHCLFISVHMILFQTVWADLLCKFPSITAPWTWIFFFLSLLPFPFSLFLFCLFPGCTQCLILCLGLFLTTKSYRLLGNLTDFGINAMEIYYW